MLRFGASVDDFGSQVLPNARRSAEISACCGRSSTWGAARDGERNLPLAGAAYACHRIPNAARAALLTLIRVTIAAIAVRRTGTTLAGVSAARPVLCTRTLAHARAIAVSHNVTVVAALAHI